MYSSHLRNICDSLLSEGRIKFLLSMGVVSRIENDEYKIVAISSQSDVFTPGQSFKLMDTHCRDVYEKRKTIAITELDDCNGLQKHPLYKALPLEAYISSPILVNGEVWGIINFSSMTMRTNGFSKEDIQFNEDAAQTIAIEVTT